LAIDGNANTYLASDFPDGNWSIEQPLEADRQYAIDIRWFHGETLLLHEFGSFFTDADSPVVTLDLDFADSGTREFDNDCDGINNLKEISDGIDPGNNLGTSCPQDESLISPQAVYVVRNYLSFEQSGYSDDISSFEQPIRIRVDNTDRNVSYWMILSTDEPIEIATEATIQLSYQDDLGKYAYFEINESVASQQGLTATCGTVDSNGRFCRIPLNWQADRWYTLKLERVGEDQWQASIVESESGDLIHSGTTDIKQYDIGTITTLPGTRWNKPRFGLNYRGTIESFSTCENGLPRLAMQAENGNTNGVFDNLLPSSITISRCVDAGIGWRAGIREINGSRRYSLSVGDGRALQ